MAPTLLALIALATTAAAFVKVDPNNLPEHSEKGMYGTNKCGKKDSASSKCQTSWINSAQDFCFFAPPTTATVGDAERISVTYCSKAGHGARLVPKGTFKSIHYVKTPHYIQITGTGDFTKVHVKKGDEGGELDPKGYDGLGNPIGGLMLGNGTGKAEQFENWTEFISDNEFCLRVCHNNSEASRYCEHIYDVMGCMWNMPGNYGSGFETCQGNDVSHPMGEYVLSNGKTSTWHQGVKPTPPANPAPKSSKCSKFTTTPASYPKSKRFGPVETPVPAQA